MLVKSYPERGQPYKIILTSCVCLSEALHLLGRLYQLGRQGLPIDYQMAHKFYLQAATQQPFDPQANFPRYMYGDRNHGVADSQNR